MKKLQLLILAALCFSGSVTAQQETKDKKERKKAKVEKRLIGNTYVVQNDALKVKGFAEDGTPTKSDTIDKNTTLIVTGSDDANYFVKSYVPLSKEYYIYAIAKKRFDGTNLAEINKIYSSTAWGVWTVPFKFDPKTYKRIPSGAVMGYFGVSLNNWRRNWKLDIAPMLGVSQLPSDEDPSGNNALTATTLGLGITPVIASDFNIGLYLGWDIYNQNGRKRSPFWMSFGFGFDFGGNRQKKNVEKEEDKTKVITAPKGNKFLLESVI